MSRKTIYPLSGRGNEINYEKHSNGFYVEWSTTKFFLTNEKYQLILSNFFKDKSNWYVLGVSETEPIKGGFGELQFNT